MRRFHVHLSVENIAESTTFYSNLFGAPARIEHDYVKWMVEDPRINFAISKRGAPIGLNHLGMQLDTDAELQQLQSHLRSADAGLVAELDSSCCYVKSDKYWITDPQGIAFETYHTLHDIPLFHGEASRPEARCACCVPDLQSPAAALSQAAATEPAVKGCCA